MKKTESAGGVVLNQEGKVLVVSQHGTSWSLPKGHIEDGENQIEAAEREIHEETGVDKLIFKKDLGSYERYRIGLKGADDKTELKKIHMFLFETKQTDLKPIDPHNPEAKWVNKEKVEELLTHPKDKAFYKSILSKI